MIVVGEGEKGGTIFEEPVFLNFARTRKFSLPETLNLRERCEVLLVLVKTPQRVAYTLTLKEFFNNKTMKKFFKLKKN